MSDFQETSRFIHAPDGLRLHWRDFDPGGHALPVVCLPGLARTAADFDVLARRIASGSHGPARRVIALDYRGRGLSDRDPDPARYDILVENADILAVLAAANIARATFIGTSRGGLHIMALGATRPNVLAAAVLNDIGPVIEASGLLRIRNYVGKLPTPKDMEDAIDLARTLMGGQFTSLEKADWQAYAELTFEWRDGTLQPRYDPRVSEALKSLDIEAGLPELWPQFDALKSIPLLILRGENSDLLSSETVAGMIQRHPGAESHVVPNQGHAPLLLDEPTLARIDKFIDRIGKSA